MPDKEPEFAASSRQRQMALSRWDNGGGAGPGGPQGEQVAEAQSQAPALTNAELVQLRIRVIALENLLIALLADASERQLAGARNGSLHLTRPGSSHHPLTVHAAAQMIDFVERAGHFRSVASS